MLIGREPERKIVDALVAGARIGHSGVLVITGEAGIGKTSLLEYAAERAGGMRLLKASGAEAERGVGFGFAFWGFGVWDFGLARGIRVFASQDPGICGGAV